MKVLLTLVFMIMTTSLFAQSEDCSYYLSPVNSIGHKKMERFLKKFDYHLVHHASDASSFVKATVDRHQEVGSTKVTYQAMVQITDFSSNNFIKEVFYESSTSAEQAVRKLFKLMNLEMDRCRTF